jgi:hypothetical protein
MNNIVVMVEEASMKVVVEEIAKKLGLKQRTTVLSHQGKTDLEASFPRKLKSWNMPGETRFVICRDNDGSNCRLLKDKLVESAKASAKHEFKVRIVMNELEAWYLGDLPALEHVGLVKPGFAKKYGAKKSFREPERLTNAKQELLKLVKSRGQNTLAKIIAPHLDLEQNAAPSFIQFVSALQWAAA